MTGSPIPQHNEPDTEQLSRPGWFPDVRRWLNDLSAASGAGDPYEPVGVDSHGRLHIRCDTRTWYTQLRFLAPKMLSRIREEIPQAAGLTAVTASVSHRVPRKVLRAWPDLLGGNLAERVTPLMIDRGGRRLCVMTDTPETRREAHKRLTEAARDPLNFNALIRAGIDDIASIARPIVVAVVASEDFTDLELVEQALLDTWHDATQVHGIGRPLWFACGTGTTVAERVRNWADHHADADPFNATVSALTQPALADVDAQHSYNLSLLLDNPDLCLAFFTNAETGPLTDQLHSRQRWNCVPVLRWDRPGADTA